MATFSRRHPPPKKRKDCKYYGAYREEVRKDFKGYCAYCGVHENDWPHNIKNYQLDHFRPKGNLEFPEFQALINDFYNLHWCCHICNRADAKGDTWPSPEEEEQGYGFVDLCKDDWTDHYRIFPDGRIEAITKKARYTIRLLSLDNEDYTKHRREILQRGGALFSDTREVAKSNS